MLYWFRKLSVSPFVWLTLALVFSTIVMKLIDNALVTSAAPAGIISFQLAGDVQRLSEIITHWDDATQKLVIFHLGLDFLYLTIYSSFLFIVARRLQKRVSIPQVTPKWLEQCLAYLPWLAIWAGICDFIEDYFAIQIMLNLSTLTQMNTEQMTSSVEWMWLFAMLKFSFLGVVFLQIIYYFVRYRMTIKG